MTEKKLSLLVPVDASPESESVLPMLLPLLRARPADVTLLQVVPRAEDVGGAQAHLEDCRARLAEQGVSARGQTVWGRPVERILEAVRQGGHDLIAMGTHGRRGRARLLLGSVAEEVVAASPVPVLLCRPDIRLRDWKRLLVPLDGTPEAELALSDAVPLARVLGATIHLLRVRLALVHEEGYRGMRYCTPCADSNPYLEGVSERLAKEGVLTLTELREGLPAEEILKAVECLDVGLICLATEGGPLAERNVTAELIRRAGCPVLVRKLLSKKTAPCTP